MKFFRSGLFARRQARDAAKDQGPLSPSRVERYTQQGGHVVPPGSESSTAQPSPDNAAQSGQSSQERYSRSSGKPPATPPEPPTAANEAAIVPVVAPPRVPLSPSLLRAADQGQPGPFAPLIDAAPTLDGARSTSTTARIVFACIGLIVVIVLAGVALLAHRQTTASSAIGQRGAATAMAVTATPTASSAPTATATSTTSPTHVPVVAPPLPTATPNTTFGAYTDALPGCDSANGWSLSESGGATHQCTSQGLTFDTPNGTTTSPFTALSFTAPRGYTCVPKRSEISMDVTQVQNQASFQFGLSEFPDGGGVDTVFNYKIQYPAGTISNTFNLNTARSLTLPLHLDIKYDGANATLFINGELIQTIPFVTHDPCTLDPTQAILLLYIFTDGNATANSYLTIRNFHFAPL